MTTYRVTGSLPYQRVRPGDVFEAQLAPDVERRAVARGAIEILDATPPGLKPGSYQPPPGWDTRHTIEAPPGASSVEGSN